MFDCTGLLAVPLPAIVGTLRASPPPPRPSGHCPSQLSVNVHQQLLLDGRPHPRVWAIGDCAHPPLPCPKLAYTAELQAAVAADNVAALALHSAPAPPLSFPRSLSTVLPAPSLVCCSLGAWDGVLVFNDVAVTGLLAAAMKLLIELSKVRQYRGSAAAELLWAVAEPSVFAVNRLYHSFKGAASVVWAAAAATRHRIAASLTRLTTPTT